MSSFDPSIFRAYDMRGTYPDQMNETVAYAAGQAFVAITGAKTVVIGRDVRSTGVSLVEAVSRGVTEAGAHAVIVGVISTEMLYFAAATLECDGGMSITASHNPAQWNGIKFIGKDAKPLTREGELGDIYLHMQQGTRVESGQKGEMTERDLLPDYVAYLREKFLPKNLAPLKIVGNVNFGANGKIIDATLAGTPIDLVRLNWNEDGTFPKGTPDPLLPSNRAEIMERITTENAHFGVAWDADADRCFFYDEKGRFFHGYYITALLISHYLTIEPGAAVVVERRLTWANVEAAKAGKLVFSRTGHGYIKAVMRAESAVFGGESSGHYYFRDFFFCDNGMVSFLLILEIFANQIAKGGTVSEILDYYMTNFPIVLEEQNYITERAGDIQKECAERYADAEQNHEDGLTVEYADWRFNIRSSSNEPVLRLNMEAKNQEALTKRHAEIAELVASFGAVLRDDHA